jgi:hypothetical protein
MVENPRPACGRTEPAAQTAAPEPPPGTPSAPPDGSIAALNTKVDTLIAEMRQFERRMPAGADRLQI